MCRTEKAIEPLSGNPLLTNLTQFSPVVLSLLKNISNPIQVLRATSAVLQPICKLNLDYVFTVQLHTISWTVLKTLLSGILNFIDSECCFQLLSNASQIIQRDIVFTRKTAVRARRSSHYKRPKNIKLVHAWRAYIELWMHEGRVRVARGTAECNSSFLSALQSFQVHR